MESHITVLAALLVLCLPSPAAPASADVGGGCSGSLDLVCWYEPGGPRSLCLLWRESRCLVDGVPEWAE